MNNFDRIRELAPTKGSEPYLEMGYVIGEDIGAIEVVTSGGRTLGATDLGRGVPARLVVDEAGLSRQSGGELYVPLELHIGNVDHYFISDLPEIVIETRE